MTSNDSSFVTKTELNNASIKIYSGVVEVGV